MKTNTIRHKIVGDTTIDEDTELHGMIAGTVTVAEDAILQLHGKVAGGFEHEQYDTTNRAATKKPQALRLGLSGRLCRPPSGYAATSTAGPCSTATWW